MERFQTTLNTNTTRGARTEASTSTTSSPGNVAFMFHYGHGHASQFENFRECVPDSYRDRAAWIALRGTESGSLVARIPGLSERRRHGLHYMWNGYNGLRQRSNWQALFIAGCPPSFLPLVHRFPSFLYNDLTPSLVASLAPWYPPRARARGIRYLIRTHMSRRARGIFTMSKWAAAGHAHDFNLPPEQLHVVLPGANLARWSFVDRSRRPSGGPVRILMVGGQFRLKGGDLILQWAEQTRSRNWELEIVTWPTELPDWILDALGRPGADTRATASLAPRYPNVRVHCGVRANTAEIMSMYEAADIFCLPTQADGSSIASLEAMASGLPVVVGSVGGIPELISEGRTGFLMERSNVDDMAAKLDRLIEDRDLRLEIGENARQSCEDYYNVPRQIREIMEVIDRDSLRSP